MDILCRDTLPSRAWRDKLSFTSLSRGGRNDGGPNVTAESTTTCCNSGSNTRLIGSKKKEVSFQANLDEIYIKKEQKKSPEILALAARVHTPEFYLCKRVTFYHLFCWNDHKFLYCWCFSSSHLCLSSNAENQSDPASEICVQHNRPVLRLMRYPGHYLLSYISYWLHCLSSLHVRALPLRLDSLHRLFLPPVGCLLRSASVSPTCTLPRVRRPRLCRSRWRLNSHDMQSASLYNYASITCSVYALISHFKSMTRTYQGFFEERSRFAAHAGYPPHRLIYNRLERLSQASHFEMFGRNHLAGRRRRGGGGQDSLTHGRNAGISRHRRSSHAQTAPSVDWPWLHSVTPEGSRMAASGVIGSGGVAAATVGWKAADLLKAGSAVLMKAGRIGSDTA